MNTFYNLLQKAKKGDAKAIKSILTILNPQLLSASYVDGEFDEDLLQELYLLSLGIIEKFE